MPNENIGPKSDIQICVPDFKNKVAYMTWYDFFELKQPPNLKSLRENQSSYIREVASDSGRVIKKDWVYDNFNLQTPQKVPLVLVKAVGTTAEQKGDDLASLLPLVTKFNAYLNTNSVQEWFIDIDTPDELKKLKMTIRSDAGVREGKSIAKLGRLAKFSMLKLQYSGVLDR